MKIPINPEDVIERHAQKIGEQATQLAMRDLAIEKLQEQVAELSEEVKRYAIKERVEAEDRVEMRPAFPSPEPEEEV